MNAKFRSNLKISYYLKKILKLQEKAIQIINFKPSNTPAGPILKENKILKILSEVY